MALRTGSWAIMDWNWGGLTTPESRRNSSSVRMVERERLMPALSAMVAVVFGFFGFDNG